MKKDGVTIHFRQADGTVRTGIGSTGSVMELAVSIGVAGIEGQCGGCVSCGTCHVHVPDDWLTRTGKAEVFEIDLLEFEPEFQPNSRLSCQIMIEGALDGLTVDVPRR